MVWRGVAATSGCDGWSMSAIALREQSQQLLASLQQMRGEGAAPSPPRGRPPLLSVASPRSADGDGELRGLVAGAQARLAPFAPAGGTVRSKSVSSPLDAALLEQKRIAQLQRGGARVATIDEGSPTRPVARYRDTDSPYRLPSSQATPEHRHSDVSSPVSEMLLQRKLANQHSRAARGPGAGVIQPAAAAQPALPADDVANVLSLLVGEMSKLVSVVDALERRMDASEARS